jgi:hypothetical protein
MKTKLIFLGVVSLAFVAATTYPGESIFQGIVKQQTSDGGVMGIKTNCVTELVDSGSGTQTIPALIPAKARNLGVSCRVDTVIVGAGATTFSLGDGTDADLYGTGLAFAAGTTVGTSNLTASPFTQAWSASALALTMTADAGQFDSGAITCCAHYLDFTAPAS